LKCRRAGTSKWFNSQIPIPMECKTRMSDGKGDICTFKTWKPTVAGVLTIITGTFICQFQLGKVIRAHSLTWPLAIGTAITVALGLTAVLGGVSAVRRKAWRLALAGAVCALFPPHAYGRLIWTSVLGILSILLVATSRNEFSSAGEQFKSG